MRPVSIDLRIRIVAAVQAGEHSLRQLAGLFNVNLSTIVRLLQRFRLTESVQPKSHGGGARSKLDAAAVARLLDAVRQQPDATLAELRDRVGAACSVMAIFRALQRHHITRKKKTTHAQERDTPRVRKQRRDFGNKMADVAAENLVFIDETGATTAMRRTYGRAPVGERVMAAAPGVWKNVTLISGLRTSGVVATMALPARRIERPSISMSSRCWRRSFGQATWWCGTTCRRTRAWRQSRQSRRRERGWNRCRFTIPTCRQSRRCSRTSRPACEPSLPAQSKR